MEFRVNGTVCVSDNGAAFLHQIRKDVDELKRDVLRMDKKMDQVLEILLGMRKGKGQVEAGIEEAKRENQELEASPVSLFSAGNKGFMPTPVATRFEYECVSCDAVFVNEVQAKEHYFQSTHYEPAAASFSENVGTPAVASSPPGKDSVHMQLTPPFKVNEFKPAIIDETSIQPPAPHASSLSVPQKVIPNSSKPSKTSFECIFCDGVFKTDHELKEHCHRCFHSKQCFGGRFGVIGIPVGCFYEKDAWTKHLKECDKCTERERSWNEFRNAAFMNRYSTLYDEEFVSQAYPNQLASELTLPASATIGRKNDFDNSSNPERVSLNDTLRNLEEMGLEYKLSLLSGMDFVCNLG